MVPITFATLDVRPMLAAGEPPLAAILEAAAGIPEGASLEIVAPLEPVPLYGLLSERGFAHATAELGPGEWLVRFTQTGITRTATVAAIHERHPATAGVLARHGLDLCCGGGKTLAFVAGAHGLDLARLLVELQEAALRAEIPRRDHLPT